jgi:hypothetical protein
VNERDAVELLERVADAVDVGPPPIERIAAEGRRRERARRRWAAVGAVAIVSLLVVPGAVFSQLRSTTGPSGGGETSSPVQPTESPTSSANRAEVVTVPWVVGLNRIAAIHALVNRGLTVTFDSPFCHPPAACPIEQHAAKRVVDQRPKAWTKVDEGSSVSLTVEAVSSHLAVWDIRMAQRFVSFARGQSRIGPFDTPIGLGVGGSFVKWVEPTSPATAWELAPPTASGVSGTVSALRFLSQYDGDLGILDVADTVCGTRPATGLGKITGGGEVSIQPIDAQSCLQWFSVDLYMNDVDQVVGVNLRIGSP